MNDEQVLKSRFSDLATKSYKQNIYTYTAFLTPCELKLLEDMGEELSYVSHDTFGGHELCERKIARFGSVEQLGYDEEWPISTILVEPLIDKFADELSHRDFLGSIMNLGIDRGVLGDILVKDGKRAYIFCHDRIAEYLAENITKIRHTNVRCRVLLKGEDVPELKVNLTDMSIVVAAPRFDAIVAALAKCSRSEAQNLFRAGKVTLGGRVCEKNSLSLKDGDIFSIRGHGKYRFCGNNGETRKGRIYVRLEKYQ